MRKSDIELWALNIVDRVKRGQPVEDDRVELKRDWPAPANKAARRLAGHANAARGEPILWLIGLDEESGVQGAAYADLAAWHQQITAEFDQIVPFMQALSIPADGHHTIVALLFETDRAPFVIRNPTFGVQGGVSIKWEVPWREGTAVRSATRTDLLRLLVPVQRKPHIELLNSRFTLDSTENGVKWNLVMGLYVTPATHERLVIPFHRCSAFFTFKKSNARFDFKDVTLSPISFFKTKTVEASLAEVLISGPGNVDIIATLTHSLSEPSMDAAQLKTFITSEVVVHAKVWLPDEQFTSITEELEPKPIEAFASAETLAVWASKI